MSSSDGLILVAGIIVPIIILQFIFAAGLVCIVILVGHLVYYRRYKAHLIKTHPDKLLLEEIRRQY